MENLKNKRIAILVADGFEEIELTSPKEALENAGAKTDIISPAEGTVRAKNGDEWSNDYPVDVALQEAEENRYDGLLLPGGVINPDKLRTNKTAIALINAFWERDKPIAAICHGPQLLINADLVRDKKITSVEAIQMDLINAGALWEDSEVVIDDKLITSRTPDDLPAFNKAIIKAFATEKKNKA
ncbi:MULTISPECIES: type 1 glutamine amidotransferase domain-containing protein [Sphingobacterium]|jgi:protease I|uniref:type 1 glutamine amidotransferase domain-containing protein n=2 Tax=Sphingobacterium TaxID=28453 RepID=UPI000AE3C838|nr:MULTISPECIES: type 1 glutamine amidotransferase domain-containing protein [Sphingobacterium]MDF2852042.1 protease [Sphingobacterium multivorum]QRQ63571.1 type 1 glutamine amidotransferase [Sphingobacterium multivorum]